MPNEVRFLLVLFDDVAFVATVDLPIDVADVVAGHVFPMLHELNGEAAKRTAVFTDTEPFHERPGLQAEGLDAGNDVGLELCGGHWLFLGLTRRLVAGSLRASDAPRHRP